MTAQEKESLVGELADLEFCSHLLAVIPGQAVHNAALHSPVVTEVASNPVFHLLDSIIKFALLLGDLIPAKFHFIGLVMVTRYKGKILYRTQTQCGAQRVEMKIDHIPQVLTVEA